MKIQSFLTLLYIILSNRTNSKVDNYIRRQDAVSTKMLCREISNIIEYKDKYSRKVLQLSKAAKDSLIDYYGYLQIIDICNDKTNDWREEKAYRYFTDK